MSTGSKLVVSTEKYVGMSGNAGSGVTVCVGNLPLAAPAGAEITAADAGGGGEAAAEVGLEML